MTKKLIDLPRVFAEAKITSKNDTFLADAHRLPQHRAASCARACPSSPAARRATRALAKAATELLVSTGRGRHELQVVGRRAERPACGRPTTWRSRCSPTAQLWDLPAFKVAYASLKASVAEFEACAIGCGAWANHDTVKEVATKGGGEALIESVDSSVSSMATRLLGKCFASMAIKHAIVVEDHVLAHKGAVGRTRPPFARTAPTGRAAPRRSTPSASAPSKSSWSSARTAATACSVPTLAQVVGDGNPSSLRWTARTCRAT